LLAGTYERSPWVVERAWPRGPYRTLAHLKRTLVEIVAEAERDEQLALLRAHPELAGKAMAAGTLTAESSREQDGVGLTACTPDELATIARLNAAYRERFGFPFMLAVRGPRGTGLAKAEIIGTFERRLENHPDFELAEAIRNVHRVAELRLDDRFAARPALGEQAWDCAELLARHSDPGFAENGQLTVTYLTDAHRACAAQLVRWMRECGFDSVKIDAVGNVVGVYRSESEAGSNRPSPAKGRERIGSGPVHHEVGPVKSPRLLTGSHYDTVRNGGRYDGRLGIFVPMICVRELSRAGRRLPFAIELVAFAEEEGQRYKATFLGSGALVGRFETPWLDQADAAGVTMREAMRHAGLAATPRAIARLKRDPADYLGFVEVHIEQGPVLKRARPAARRRHVDQRRRALSPARCAAWRATPGRRRWRAGATPPPPSPSSPSSSRSARAKRRTWSARWGCSRCRMARPTSFPAAAASRSTSARRPTRCATRAPTTSSPRPTRSAPGAASRT
jgi:N-carbamoyl-L-amino-acid hydrolase